MKLTHGFKPAVGKERVGHSALLLSFRSPCKHTSLLPLALSGPVAEERQEVKGGALTSWCCWLCSLTLRFKCWLFRCTHLWIPQRCPSTYPCSWLRQFLPQMTSCDTRTAPVLVATPHSIVLPGFPHPSGQSFGLEPFRAGSYVAIPPPVHWELTWETFGILALFCPTAVPSPCPAILGYSGFFFRCAPKLLEAHMNLTPNLIFVHSGGRAHSKYCGSALVLADNPSL